MLLFVLACTAPDSDTKNPGADADTDTDTDSDADADSDSDTDTDTDPCGDLVVAELGTLDCPAPSTVWGTEANELSWPRDLEFAPETGLLWVADSDFSGMVIFTDAGTDQQTVEKRVDYYAGHFMDTVSSIAFGTDNTFSSCQESRDDWNDYPQAEDDFMGPTLWDADLDVFAAVGQTDDWQTQEGSHLDMLHQSPWCMGIAHDHDNAYWAFDGLNSRIVYYDFHDDHGPGGADHSDGEEVFYEDVIVTRVEGVPGHMVKDPGSDWLYINDTGTGRVIRLDTASGDRGNHRGDPNWDGVAIFDEVEGATVETIVDGLDQPSGLVLSAGRLFVAEYGTGRIRVFDLDGAELTSYETDAVGLMGLTMAPDGALWYTDGPGAQVVRIDR